MKIEVDSKKLGATIVAAAILAAFAWMWNINERVAKIESPSSMLSRVETLEKLTFPIAVEYEVRKRLGEVTDIVQPEPEILVYPKSKSDAPIMPPPILSSDTADDLPPDDLRLEAEDDVRSMIEQRPIEESRKRRGRPVKLKKRTRD